VLTSDHVSRSSVVQKTLLEAWAGGTRFSVIVVDSRPMLEGILCSSL
jgi:translation initiation factor eIF-2B subunit delta